MKGKLIRIKTWRVPTDYIRKEIRIDWDNDRHQAIALEGRTPQDVINALNFLVDEIKHDMSSGEI